MSRKPISLVTSICLLHFTRSGSENGFPQINKVQQWDEPMHLKAGDTLELSCVNPNSPPQWTLPNRSKFVDPSSLPSSDYLSRFPVITTQTTDDQSRVKFDSRFKIANTVAADTGWYTCTDATTGVKSAVFVYVNDGSLLLRLNDITTSNIVTDQEDYLPCVSPQPNVAVSYELSPSLGNSRTLAYKNGVGFIVPPHTFTSHQGKINVTCLASATEYNRKESFTYEASLSRRILEPLGLPSIAAPNAATAYNGMSLKMLCSYAFMINANGKCEWILPKSANLNVEDNKQRMSTNIHYFGSKTTAELVVDNLLLTDSGLYTCTCKDRENHSNSSNIFINVSSTYGQVVAAPLSNHTEFIKPVGAAVEFQITYKAWPTPVNIIWLHSYYDVQTNDLVTRAIRSLPKRGIDDKNISVLRGAARFPLSNLTVRNSGNYTVSVSAGTVRMNITFQLHVTDTRTTQNIYTDISQRRFQFLQLNDEYNITCASSGNYPLTNATWRWKPCRSSENCSILPLRGDELFIRKKQLIEGTYEKGIRLTTVALNTTTLYCGDYASNNENILEYVVTDVPESVANDGMGISVDGASGPAGTVLQGDNLTLSCKAQNYAYKHLNWTVTFSNGSRLAIESADDDRKCGAAPSVYRVECSVTQYSRNFEIQMRDVQFSDNAIFVCSALAQQSDAVVRNYSLIVNPSYKPYFEPSPTDVVANYSKPVSLFCLANAMPAATILWYKANKPITNGTHEKTLTDRNQTFKINFAVKDDAGDYRCEATNRLGTAVRDFRVTVHGAPSVEISTTSQIILGVLLAVVGGFVIGLVIAVVILTKRNRQRQARIGQLQKDLWTNAISNDMNTSHFEINPCVPLYDQMDHLQYDTRFEIPREMLELNERDRLGAGNFGKVVKGTYFADPNMQTGRRVAVKMPKVGTNEDHLNALLSELKVMIYVGRHPNILRLLGAVTKNMIKGELYIVMELCSEGSLLEHLKNLREVFDNELVDKVAQQSVNILPMTTDQLHQPLAVALWPMEESCYRNEINPDWSRILHRKRSMDTHSVLATSDLLSYEYQIAQGMEYLASRKVIHRDLAARNVLLTDNRVVKICDFGLARQQETYKTKNNKELPFCWMALESLLHLEYSVKSDVWSYGVVLWELFTLGEKPYGNMTYPHLREFLKLGRRMDQPGYSPYAVYNLMRQCWLNQSDDRPSFTDCKLVMKRELELCSPEMCDIIQRVALIEDNCTTNEAHEESQDILKTNKEGYSLVPNYAASEEVSVESSSIDNRYLTPDVTSTIDDAADDIVNTSWNDKQPERVVYENVKNIAAGQPKS